MGIFDGVLLASDYDGTLASSDGSISPHNKEMISRFISEGGFFTVCTGRSVQGFHAFDPALMNAPVIVANGAVLYDYNKRRTVHSIGISAEHIYILENLLAEFPFICAELYSYREQTFVLNVCRQSRRHLEGQSIQYTVIDDFRNAEYPVVKLMLYVGRENSAAVQSYLSQADLLDMKYIPTDGEFIELLHKNTDKGKALLSLADELGIRHGNVFAVGDGSNDAEMLKAAAVGFVPANGDAFAMRYADEVVRDNDDSAIADVIMRIENRIR